MLDANISMNLNGLDAYVKDLDEALQSPLTGKLAPVFNQWGQRYRAFIQKRFVIYSKGGGDWAPLKLRTILNRRSGGKNGQTIGQMLRKKKAKSLEVSYGKTKSQNFDFGSKYGFEEKPAKTPKPGRKGKSISEQLGTVKRARKKGKAAKKFLKSNSKKAIKGAKAKVKQLKKWYRSKGKKPGSPKPKGQVKVKLGMLRDSNTLFQALAPMLNTSLGAKQTQFDGGIRLGFEGGTHPDGKVTVAQLALWHNDGAGKLPKRQIIVEPDDNLKTLMVGDLERGIKRLDKDT